jgi:CDP-diacylglycerol--glycerol-3-phosphate 3-phosphatidyltransferase
VLANRLRQPIDRWVRPLGKTLGRTGISPNVITVLGVVIVAVGTVVFAGAGHLKAGALIIAVGGFTDLFDGAVAKATGRVTRFGSFLDSTTDRISDGIFFSGIVWYLMHRSISGPDFLGIPGRAYPPVAVLLTLGVLVLGFLTSYIKARAEAMGLRCDVGIAERGERVFIACVAVFFNRIVLGLALLAVLSLITVVQRFAVVWRQAKTS